MTRAPKLAVLAAIINASGRFEATIVKGWASTDRKIAGTRLRHPGKGRNGNRLQVRDLKGKLVLDHNSAETYRSNGEVVHWMEQHGLPVQAEWPRS